MELATEDGPVQPDNFLSGGGEMGARMREFDWSKTSLGPVEDWPQSLRTAVSICLSSRFPMVIWWGPDLILLYNDGWRPILGATKHPRALGSPGREVWPEIWDVIGPMFDSVMTTGQATWSDDALLLVNRYGYTEETYFTWSYSPIRDESGGVGGVFTAVTETTERVIGERRMRTLRDLAARSLEARQVDEACRIAGETLAANPYDIPFALLYLLDGNKARLMYAAGIDPGLHSSPLSVDLKNFPTTTVWPLAKVAHSGHAQALDCSGQLFEDLPERPWQARPQKAKVMPVILPGQVLPSMLLVLAISPRRVFDDAYQNFFDLIASQIGSTLADALAYEQEKKRAEALMELDRAKTAFFSNVSHEFRTPLNAMFGWARLLSERRLDEETIARGLKSIGQNAKAQAQLIEDLLDVSRIISGKFRLKVEPVQVAPVIEAAIDSIRPAADAKGVRIQFSSDHDAGPVSGDAGRIQQVVWNLLSNAVKFTPNGGRVEVRLSRAGSHVEIEVSDTGQGIGAEFLPFVFDRFRQADGSTTRTHGGLGLGLAIVRHIAELHGGSVAANSPGIGHGAIFTVRLPLMTIEKKPSDAKSAVPSVTNEVAPASAHTQSLEGVKVLIVDDDLEALLLLSTALTHSGAYVKTASSVEEGFTHVKEWRPDVIVSDIAMPSEDGYSFIKRVRAWSSGDGGWIPAVALTAYARAEDRMKAIDSGYQIHVPKPVEPLELITAVASLIGQHRDHTPAGDPGQDGS